MFHTESILVIIWSTFKQDEMKVNRVFTGTQQRNKKIPGDFEANVFDGNGGVFTINATKNYDLTATTFGQIY